MYTNAYYIRQVPLVNGIFHLVSGLGTLPFTSVLTSPGPPLRPFPCGDIYTFLLQILPR